MPRQQRRMKANRFVARRIKNWLGNYQRHEREDREVCVEGPEMLVGGVALERFRLAEREPKLARFRGERVGLADGRIGRRKDVHDLVGMIDQRLDSLNPKS